MSVYLQKVKSIFREWSDMVPTIFFIAFMMLMFYVFMIVGCALDDACYEVNVRSIEEVPDVRRD